MYSSLTENKDFAVVRKYEQAKRPSPVKTTITKKGSFLDDEVKMSCTPGPASIYLNTQICRTSSPTGARWSSINTNTQTERPTLTKFSWTRKNEIRPLLASIRSPPRGRRSQTSPFRGRARPISSTIPSTNPIWRRVLGLTWSQLGLARKRARVRLNSQCRNSQETRNVRMCLHTTQCRRSMQHSRDTKNKANRRKRLMWYKKRQQESQKNKTGTQAQGSTKWFTRGRWVKNPKKGNRAIWIKFVRLQYSQFTTTDWFTSYPNDPELNNPNISALSEIWTAEIKPKN